MVDNSADQLCKWQDVLRGEHDAVNLRRTKQGRVPVQASNIVNDMAYGESGDFDTIGLCLSGGGIRSAAFCLGALQALKVNEKFERVDYISTVSGGGYIGASLTSALTMNGGEFPFVKPGKDMSDAAPIGHLRDYSNYLIPNGKGDILSDLTIVVRGLISIALMVIPILLTLAALTVYLNHDRASLTVPNLAFRNISGLPFFTGPFAWSASLALLIPVFFSAWAIYRSVFKSKVSEFSGPAIMIATFSLTALAIVAFCELQPVIVWGMYRQFHQGDTLVAFDYFGWIKSLLTLTVPVFVSVSVFAKKIADAMKFSENSTGFKSFLRKIISTVLVWAAGLALPIILWAGYLFLVYWAIPDVGKPQAPEWMWQLWRFLDGHLSLPRIEEVPPFALTYVLLAVAMFGLSLLISPNSNSLHSLYRDRLGTAFLWARNEATGLLAKSMTVSQLNPTLSPYHIINAAVNIQGSPEANRRARNADFFHFGNLYSGSEATGYVSTANLEKDNTELSLASGIAISGAAISSNMGSVSIKPMTPTLALLNLRLGYWLRNPLSQDMGVNQFYLLREIFSRLRPQGKWLYLTDGGHIENLGAYQLLKRRSKLIIVIDAEADPYMTFGALVKLERYARIDLGVRINLNWDTIAKAALNVRNIDAKPAHGPHCAIGEIIYSNGGKGSILYVKSSLTGDENVYVRDYARRNSDFPHETTGDQFFSEEQFEVYRALGFHCLHGLFKKVDADDVARPDGPPEVFFGPKPKDVKRYDHRRVLNF
jgi:Patatin-like phospholipase